MPSSVIGSPGIERPPCLSRKADTSDVVLRLQDHSLEVFDSLKCLCCSSSRRNRSTRERAVKANFWTDSTIGLFGASFGAPLDENQESGLPAQSKEANAGGCFGGMGDTGIEPVTISL